MPTYKIILLFVCSVVLSHAVIPLVHAEEATAPAEKGFGKFEVGLPGLDINTTIDSFVSKPDPILRFINLAVNAVIAVLVIIGLITITVGGYLYMTAAGNGGQIKTAKEMIIAALIGIFLSLISVVILTTINSYLGTGAKEPTLGGESRYPGAGGGEFTSDGDGGGALPNGGSALPDGGGASGGFGTSGTSISGLSDQDLTQVQGDLTRRIEETRFRLNDPNLDASQIASGKARLQEYQRRLGLVNTEIGNRMTSR